MGTGVSPSHRIVTQIAAAEGVSPIDLEPPLHAVVDPDALDQLVESNGAKKGDVSIAFTYRGHRVHVDGNGTVDVTTANQPTDANGESTEGSHGD